MKESVSGERLESVRLKLRDLVAGHGGATAVARLSDVPLASLKRYLSGSVKKIPLDVIERIAGACGVPLGNIIGPEAPGLSEPDVTPYDGPKLTTSATVPANHGRWFVRNRALELAGVLPGDVIEFEFGADPRPGDPVVAQVYSEDGMTARTLLRIFQPPVLIAQTADPAIDATPLVIDEQGERVNIMGAFVRLVRQRDGKRLLNRD